MLLRPCWPRKRVIAGSPRVQSPTRVTTPWRAKAACVASRSIAIFSLTLLSVVRTFGADVDVD